MARPTNANRKVIELIHTGLMGEAGGGTRPVINVYHFRRDPVGVTPIINSQVFTAWKAQVGDKVILGLNERYTSQSVSIRCINDAEERATDHSFTDPGAIEGDPLPGQECVTIHLNSDTRGRWAQGRKNFGPLTVTDIEGDTLVAGSQTIWNLVRTNLLAGFTDAGGNIWKPTVVSKTYSDLTTNGANGALVFEYPVTSASLNKNLGSMDSRKIARVK